MANILVGVLAVIASVLVFALGAFVIPYAIGWAIHFFWTRVLGKRWNHPKWAPPPENIADQKLLTGYAVLVALALFWVIGSWVRASSLFH